MQYKRLLTLMIMIYMAAALSWWSILLHRQNQEIYRLEQQVRQENQGSLKDEVMIERSHKRKSIMILGEGLVFIAALGIGLYLINRSYYQELAVATQKQNFLLSITHELKSPIAGIRLVLETIQKRSLSAEQQSTLIQGALNENNRLEKLIQNLLLAAQVEAAYGMEPEALDINDMIRQAKNTYTMNHPYIHWDLQLSKLPPLWADRKDVESILANLIENAIKYQKEPQYIGIRTTKSSENLILEVSDHGDGIDARERKLIFEKFYRIGQESTRKTSGTGLGLYIVKKIMERHKGQIQVLPNEPRGSRFLVTFPNILENQ
ncbi:MAG: HAMP domain-containing histidine kinase [Saprospiraceae bacterium]|nr:HAMP domain-containing histidine kinase [Saprospiraceae bacterium]MCB9318473.1 HAMP domain-containing histidine kinase [Lewinellaceae bacterium]